MSKKNKLQKFADILTFPNVYENINPMNPELSGLNGEIVDLKGRWSEKHFKNNNPIVLELACGKGHYTLGLAERFPYKNFIGVDIKGLEFGRVQSLQWKKTSEMPLFSELALSK